MSIEFEKGKFEDVMNLTYPGLQMFARDANLGSLESKYVPGLILIEKGFTDASNRVGGMMTSHRFAILSNHMADFSEFEHGTNWGLCIANRDSYFKVLDVYKFSGKTLITLLHLHNQYWQLFDHLTINIDKQLIDDTRDRFEFKCNLPSIPELTTEVWLDRCSAPIGIDDNGNYFALNDSEEKSEVIQNIIDSFTWTFAKTMPENPHWYIVKKYVNPENYEKLFLFIFENHSIEWFEGLSYKVVQLGEYKYWIMDDDINKSYIINRARQLLSN